MKLGLGEGRLGGNQGEWSEGKGTQREGNGARRGGGILGQRLNLSSICKKGGKCGIASKS